MNTRATAVYRLRYAFAFAKAILPRRWWLHPVALVQWMRLGADDCDAGEAWQEEYYSAEEAGEESAYYLRHDA